jgi:hypothetical protein
MDTKNSIPVKVCETGDNVTVQLIANYVRDVHPSVLAEPEIKDLPCAGKKVLLEGKAPLWMYANFALLAARNSAVEVSIKQADAGTTKIWAEGPLLNVGAAAAGAAEWFKITREDSGTACLDFQKAPDNKGGKWKMEDLIKTPLSFPDMTEVLIIRGSAANWMYAAVVLAADAAGIRCIFYDSPREKSLISIGALEPGKLLPRRKRTENSIVIGIAGDPNSGKSVFRSWLEKVFKDEWPNSWWIEADPASPTPNWYLEGLNSRRAEEIAKTRKDQKIDWTHELELMVADTIRNARNNLDVILVDLPGGNVPDDGSSPQRIPPGREVIIKEVDRFIILWKNKNALDGWRSALAEHHLENRIFAEIESVNKDAPPSLETHSEGNMVIGKAQGLNREINSYAIKADIIPGAAGLIKSIHPWISKNC